MINVCQDNVIQLLINEVKKNHYEGGKYNVL